MVLFIAGFAAPLRLCRASYKDGKLAGTNWNNQSFVYHNTTAAPILLDVFYPKQNSTVRFIYGKSGNGDDSVAIWYLITPFRPSGIGNGEYFHKWSYTSDANIEQQVWHEVGQVPVTPVVYKVITTAVVYMIQIDDCTTDNYGVKIKLTDAFESTGAVLSGGLCANPTDLKSPH